MVTIRGAITVEENTREAILEGTKEMLEAIVSMNGLHDAEMLSITFSATRDLDAVYPALAAREIGITDASLLCVQEMYVQGSLMMCLRILMHVDKVGLTQKEVKHAYLRKAESLRPDLILKEQS